MTATTRARGETSGRMKRETPQRAERDAAEEQDPLQRPHGAEEHGAGDADEAEGGRGRRGRAHAGRLPAREEVVPARRPRRQRGQLADEGQRPEEEVAGPERDDEQRDRPRPRRAGARCSAGDERTLRPKRSRPARRPRSSSSSKSASSLKAEPDAAGEDRHLGRSLVRGSERSREAATALAASRPWWERRLK